MVPPTQETLISENPTKKTFILIIFQKGCQHSADNLSFISLPSLFPLISSLAFDFTELFV